MKKILSIAFTALMMIVLLPACGSNKAEEVGKKIDENKELTQADYGVMIDYVTEAFTKLSALDMSDPEKVRPEAEKLEKEYPLSEKFVQAIQKNADSLDDTNKEKFENLQHVVLKMMGIDPALLEQATGAPEAAEVKEIEETQVPDSVK